MKIVQCIIPQKRNPTFPTSSFFPGLSLTTISFFDNLCNSSAVAFPIANKIVVHLHYSIAEKPSTALGLKNKITASLIFLVYVEEWLLYMKLQLH